VWDGDGGVWSVTSERLVYSGGLQGTNAATICAPSEPAEVFKRPQSTVVESYLVRKVECELAASI
jgi:hypothetical protein